MPALLLACGLLLSAGCGMAAGERREPARDPVILVGPVSMEVAISHSEKIHTFAEPPPPDREPDIRQRLIAGVTLKAQQLLIDRLGKQPGFTVISLHDAKHFEADPMLREAPTHLDSMLAMGRAAGADMVLMGRILGYGQLPLRYWLAGWAVTASTQLTVVGVLSGGNPAVMGGYLVFDIMTDLPIWTGGFYAFGWAFRPVLVEVEAWQVAGCTQKIWEDREFALLSHKSLEAYPKEEREKKQVQLNTNLERVMELLAGKAREALKMQSCPEGSSPQSG